MDCNGRRAKTEFVTPCTIEKICKLMRCAFGQAIRWGMVGRNPFIGATLPKREQRKRSIWDAETIRRALDACEDRVIGNAFNRLKRNADLPDVVFHSLRHSSTTYKLKLNHGDIKATQGDAGHAQPDMVTEVYAHILDEDHKVNAQRFEAGFYSRADLRGLEQSFRMQTVQQPGMDIVQLLVQLQQNPALLTLLNGLANANVSG